MNEPRNQQTHLPETPRPRRGRDDSRPERGPERADAPAEERLKPADAPGDMPEFADEFTLSGTDKRNWNEKNTDADSGKFLI